MSSYKFIIVDVPVKITRRRRPHVPPVPKQTQSIVARSTARSRDAAVRSGKTALIGKGASKAKARVVFLSKALLVIRAGARARASARVSVTTRVASRAAARARDAAVRVGVTLVSARITGEARARAALKPAARLTGRFTSRTKDAAVVSSAAKIMARSIARARSSASRIGRTSIAGYGVARARSSAQRVGFQHIAALAHAGAAGRAIRSGRTVTRAQTKGVSWNRPAPSPRAHVLGRSISRSKAGAFYKRLVYMIARPEGRARGSAHRIGQVSVSAASTARARSHAQVFFGVQLFLAAQSSALSAARAVRAGSSALLGRVIARAKSSANTRRRTSVFVRGASRARARGGLSTFHPSRFLVGLATSRAHAGASRIGKVPIAAHTVSIARTAFRLHLSKILTGQSNTRAKGQALPEPRTLLLTRADGRPYASAQVAYTGRVLLFARSTARAIANGLMRIITPADRAASSQTVVQAIIQPCSTIVMAEFSETVVCEAMPSQTEVLLSW